MKFIAIFIAIMIVVSSIFGFDFSVYKSPDLSVYPELDFEQTVDDLTDSSHKGISFIFYLISGLSRGLMELLHPGITAPEESPDIPLEYMIMEIQNVDITEVDGPILIKGIISAIKAQVWIVGNGYFVRLVYWELVEQGLLEAPSSVE